MFSKPLLCLFSILFCCELAGQNKPLIVYDVATKQKSKLPIIPFDSLINQSRTDFFSGKYSQSKVDLSLEIPQENLHQNTHFTNKSPAKEFANVYDFPFSATIKLVIENDGELYHGCSAVMISSRHVLTAAHCFIDISTPNEVMIDSVYAVPMYDNGLPQTSIPKSLISKIYFFEDWNVGNGEDILVLELEKPIGEMTGWFGIGYNEDNTFFEENNFHKLSYPGDKLFDDDVDYNGDTMYYSYGRLGFLSNNSSDNYLGVPSHFGGRPGESGSSIFYTNNEDVYTTYGVLNFVSNYRHSRIQDWQFYAIKSVIEAHTIPIEPTNSIVEVSIFPNPTADRVNLKFDDFTDEYIISVVNANGQRIGFIELEKGQLETEIDLTAQPAGVYFLNIYKGKEKVSKRVVKI